MSGVGIGIGVDFPQSVFSSPQAAIKIATGGVLPGAMELTQGQTGTNLPAAWFDPANYDAPGTVTIELRVNGGMVPLDTVLQSGDRVTLQVSDDQATRPLTFIIDTKVAGTPVGLTGLLTDQSIILGAGAPAYDASVGFTGPVASYALVTAPAGVVIGTTTGLVDFSGLTTPITDAPVTVRATTADLQGVEDGFRLTAVASDISATVPPAMSPLYEGQAVRDVAGYGTMTDPANFTSNAGAIVGVAVAATGDAPAPDSPLTEGDMAGFAVTVTDSGSHEKIFTANPAPVQYRARIITSAGNNAEIDINPLVPDSATIGLTFSGTEYDGTYMPTAGQIRNELYNFVGTAGIEYPGSKAGLTVGSTLTVDPGLWSSPSGATITFSRQWRRNGADIAGATGETHDLVQADLGAAITCAVTASDGVAPGVTAVTAAVNPSAAMSLGEAPTHLQTTFVPGKDHGIDLSGLRQGDEVYFIAHIAMGSSETNRIANLTVNGATVTPARIVNTNSKNQVAVGKFVVGTGWGTITVSINGSSAANSSALSLFKANGWANPAYAVTNGGAGTTLVETVLPVLNGDHVLASASDSGRGAAPSLSGVTTITGAYATGYDTNYHVTAGAGAIKADNAGHAVRGTLPLGSQMALGTIRLTS